MRETAAELAETLDDLGRIDPRACRRHVEQQFGPDKMVAGYEQVYRDCLGEAAREQPAVADGQS